MEEIFQSSVDKNLESDDTATIESAKKEVTAIVGMVAEFSDLVGENDYDLLSPSNTKPPERPIAIRATSVKKELDETKVRIFI